MNAGFRICPATGRKIHADAESLIRANAVAATVSLLVGGIAAILVLLTRWQAVHLLDAVWFYRILTVHGISMLIFFIIFFEVAVLYFAGAVLLNSRLAAPKVAWAAFVLMVAGALLTQTNQFVGLNVLGFEPSGELLVMLILGGVGRIYGAFVGPVVYLIAQDMLAKQFPEYWYFGIGTMLVLVVMFARGGILGIVDGILVRLRRKT